MSSESPELDSFVKDFDRKVQLNVTVRQSIADRIDILTKIIIAKNPNKNRSQIVDTLLDERLAEVGVPAK